LPLEGIRVVELTNALAGPSCAVHLADWGADVIRVECASHWQPGARGLYARPSAELVKASRDWTMCYPDWEPGERPWERTAIFANTGRNKRGIALDISHPKGHAAFLRLIARSDAFIENNAPDVPERLRIGYDDLRTVNPRLVMLQMPAYGHSGPHRSFRSFGTQVEAVTGHSAIRGYPDGDPTELEPTFVSDAGAGIMGAFAIVLGLLEREQTGEGQRMELALSEGFLTWLVEPLLLYQLQDETAKPTGNRDRLFAPFGCYPCAGEDAWINICIKSDDQWLRLVDAIDDAELSDPELLSPAARAARADFIDERIGAWTKDADARSLMYRLQNLGIPAGVVNSAVEALEDPQFVAREFFQPLTHAETGTRLYPSHPFRFGPTPARHHRPPTLLGEHNESVLREAAGLSAEEYQELIRLGLVGTEFIPKIP
jgi:crotonobetainyl-CoA:carnitine CoA-transferase CaiB-like acyl-CoA transferase